MTDLTIGRATELTEPVPDALPSASSDECATDLSGVAVSGAVRLTRLLALAGLSPSQAVEVGAGLLEAVDQQVDPGGAAFATDRVMVGVDGRVAIEPGPRDGSLRAAGPGSDTTARRVAAALEQVTAASRGGAGRAEPATAPLLDELDDAVAELPVAGVTAVRQRLDEACAAIDRRAVRAELAALVRAVVESSGNAVPGGAARSARATDVCPGNLSPTGPPPAVRTRVWMWLLSVAVLVAVVALEVVLLREDIVADVHLLLEAGRSGSAASTVPQPDGLPLIPPAPPAVGTVAGVDLRPLTPCTPGAPCTVRVLLRLLPAAGPQTVSWSFQLVDRCTGATDTAAGGSVTVPARVQQVAAVDTVLLPAYRAVALVAVTDLPAAAAAPPVLIGSCAPDRTTG